MFIAWYNGNWYEAEDPEAARAAGYEVREVEFMPLKSHPEWLEPDYRCAFVHPHVDDGIEQMLHYLAAH